MTATVDAPDVYVTAVHATQLFADPAYQRDLDPRRVAKMVEAYDRRLLGVLDVSDRGDGRYAILDGQHRHAVVITVGAEGPATPVVCQVYAGLTREDEARLFHEINARRKALSWWDHWRARRGAGDEKVLAIDMILEGHGLKVHPSQQDGNIRATKALEVIVDELGDVYMLDSVLTALIAAYGRTPDAFDGAIMQGLAHVIGNYDSNEIDANRLVEALTRIPPRQLRARAGALREIQRGTLPRLCASVIVDRYNAIRGAGRRLEDFTIRVPQLAKGGKVFSANRAARRQAPAAPPARSRARDDDGPSIDDLVDEQFADDLDRALGDSDDEPTGALPAAEPRKPLAQPTREVWRTTCTCGHTKRRHEDQAGMCEVGDDCDCVTFTAAAV